MSDLASRIREAAKEIGGLNALSKAICVPRRTLGYWLEGKQPKPDALEAIANATGVSLEWLITGDGDKIPSLLMKAIQRINPRLATGIDTDELMSDEEMATAFSRLIQRTAASRRAESAPTDPLVRNTSTTLKFYPHAASAGWGQAVLDDEGAEDLDMEHFVARVLGLNVDFTNLVPVKGESMYPTLQGGDYAIIDRRQRKIVDNELFVFSLENDLYIKRAGRNAEGALLWLSDNPDYQPIILQGDEMNKMKVVGRVTNVIRSI